MGSVTNAVQGISSISNLASLGPAMFISSNANMLTRLASFIGNISNDFSSEYLKSSSHFLDTNLVPLNIFPELNFAFITIRLIDPTNDQKLIGISTLSSIIFALGKIMSALLIEGLICCIYEFVKEVMLFHLKCNRV